MINEEKNGTGKIIFPVVLELLLEAVLLFKDTEAAVNYLYCLIPLLLLTAFIGTYLYNRNGDMKLFQAVMNLAAIGCALQVYIDAAYITDSTFSLLKLLVSVVIAVIFVLFYRLIRKLLNANFTSYIMMGVSLFVYAALLIKGYDPNGYGTSAWIRIGSLTLQLTDFTKISAVLFYASLFSSRKERTDKQILVHATVFFAINLFGSLLIKELGSFLILLFFHLSILYIFMRRSTFKRNYLLAIFISIFGAVTAAFLLYKLILPSHEAGTMNTFETLLWPIVNKVHQRFSVTANIESDPYGAGYQLYQGRKALWIAGLFGNTVHFTSIPVAESDMAYVALINSFGWILGIFVIGCFARIVISGCTLSRKLVKYELQDAIVVFGATFLLFLQAMIVILGSCNIIPFTGLPIPFLSRGGTYQTIVFCFSALLLMESEYDGHNVIADDYESEKEADTYENTEDTQQIEQQ